MIDPNDAQAARDLFFRLLRADTEEEVVRALSDAGLWDEPAAWRLLGDKEDNYSTAGAQATIPESALVEKITNAIDAVLMRRCREAGIDPRSPDAPQSIREAVARFFESNPASVYAGALTEWDDTKIRTVARATTSIALTGDRRSRINRQVNYPSISILDHGEGQAPESQPDTLLSIGQSLKLNVKFQQGKFNMGGTAALRFCGDRHLQLVLSKRAPALASADGESTDWGFTIVRKDYRDGERMSAYRYLAPVGSDKNPRNGELLHFAAETLPIGPRGNDPYVDEVESGTLIKLYQYQTSYTTQFGQTGGLRHQLDVWLPMLPLPVRLHECRWGGDPRSAEWNLTGLVRRLKEAPTLEFHDTGSMTVDGQEFGYFLFCLSDGNADRYRGSHGIVFSVGGQAHGTLHERIFSRQAVKLGPLQKSLVVIVDCSDLDVPHLEDLTSNSRDHLADSVFRRRVEEGLQDILQQHPELRRLSRERADRQLQERLGDSRPLEDVIRNIMKNSSVLNALFLAGPRLSGQRVLTEMPTRPKFEGRPHPTEFHFEGLQPGAILSKVAHLEQRVRITFETDVANDYFKRAALPGQRELIVSLNGVEVPRDQNTYTLNLHDGFAHLNFELPRSAEAGDSLQLRLSVWDETIEPFVNEALISVRSAQKAAPPRDRPEKERRSRPDSGPGGPVALRPAGIDMPRTVDVEEKDWDEHKMDRYSALRISNLGAASAEGPIQYVFYVNVDNEYLRAEQRNSKQHPDVIRSQWRFGLVLLGLSLLRMYVEADQQSKQEGVSDSNPWLELAEEEVVQHVSDAVAPVLLPMIGQLGALEPDQVAEAS